MCTDGLWRALPLALACLLAAAVTPRTASAQVHGHCCGESVVLSEEGFGFAREWSCGRDLASASAEVRVSVCAQLREKGAVCADVAGVCDCDAVRDEIESLRGRNRGLKEAAEAHRRALADWESRRWDALAGIYGARGSAAKFLESLAGSLPGGKAYQDLATEVRRAGSLLEDPAATLEEWAESAVKKKFTDRVNEAGLRGAIEDASRDARNYYERTGDARGATRRFRRRARSAREVFKRMGNVLSLPDLYRNGSELADGIQEWAEAKRRIKSIQAELDDIDRQLQENVEAIQALLEAGCEEEDEELIVRAPESGRASPGGGSTGLAGSGHIAWRAPCPPASTTAGAARGPLVLASLTAAPRSRPVRETRAASRRDPGSSSRAAAPSPTSSGGEPGPGSRRQAAQQAAAVPEPTMETGLRALTRLRTLAGLLSDLDDRVAEALVPLSPFLVDTRDELPRELQQELLASAADGLETTAADWARAHELALLVAADLELSVEDPAVRATIAGMRELDPAAWPDPADPGPLGRGSEEMIPLLQEVLADSLAEPGVRELARESLVEVGRGLGTGLDVTLPEGLPPFEDWMWVPEGGDAEAYLLRGSGSPPESAPLPPGRYDFVAAQYGKSPQVLASGVAVPDEGPAELRVGSALRLERADWVPKPDWDYGWWAVVPAGRSVEERLVRGRDDLVLVPPGVYDIHWVQQYGQEEDPLVIARNVEVEPGEVASVPFGTGIRLRRDAWVEDPNALHGWWGVTRAGEPPSARVHWGRTDSMLPLPRGRYDVYWVQEYTNQSRPLLLAEDVEVGDGVTTVRATSGIALRVGEDEAGISSSRGWWGVTEVGGEPGERVNWWSGGHERPLLLPPGRYDLYARIGGGEPELRASGIRVDEGLVEVDWATGEVVARHRPEAGLSGGATGSADEEAGASASAGGGIAALALGLGGVALAGGALGAGFLLWRRRRGPFRSAR